MNWPTQDIVGPAELHIICLGELPQQAKKNRDVTHLAAPTPWKKRYQRTEQMKYHLLAERKYFEQTSN